ncbi:MAG: hypothetical protein SHS37scaffold220_5 [Phage 67_12]|nr:MAG: hypothetical protein SHS37scaffold220_5 [Phage 67_12]
MSDETKIEWADSTFNPWEGCTKVGPGCDHCYAENRNARFAGGQAINWGPGAPRRRTTSANWRKPLQWEREAAAFQAEHGRRRRVFCASLADVFDNEVDLAWREELFALINATPSLDWLLLTKRIGNVPMMASLIPGWLPKNVWLGATIVNQAEADRDIPKLLAVPAAVRFLSMEPLLGPVDLGVPLNVSQYEEGGAWSPRNLRSHDTGLHWVIAGGESGPGARPSHPDWYRALRDQCAAAGVPYLFKQHGEWAPGIGSRASWVYMNGGQTTICGDKHTHEWGAEVVSQRVGKKAAGRLLDGVEHNGFPRTDA